MVDVPIQQEDPVLQRTSLVDIVISMVTESSTPTPPPPTTQAQVTNVSESDSSSKFEQRLLELEKKVEAMLRRAWTEKDQKWTNEMKSNLEEDMRESLIYNTSFLGEYECSSLALEGRRKKKRLDHLKQD
ncbi:hypothetical protein Tco_0834335 [Tanacetum coccineum]